jgi:hypothetical protein
MILNKFMWFLGFFFEFHFFWFNLQVYKRLYAQTLVSAYIQRLHPTAQKSWKRLRKLMT